MGRTSKAWEALQASLSQTVETVTRSSRIDIVGGGVDEIDPPEDIDELAEYSKSNAIARANLRKFVNDVWEPGYRVEGPDETVAYFEGEDDELDASPPEDTPEGGFLENAAVLAGERHKPFYEFGKECSWQRWARGTVLVEYLKADVTDDESEITGFNFIRPETIYPQVQNNTNILLDADFEDLPDDVSRSDVTFTRRDEVAAYIQFDDESILGLRNSSYFDDKQEIPLSQNDVLKQTLEPDIGGDIQKGEGVFGTSALEAVGTELEEYNQIKRDLFESTERKAYGVWTAQFKPEVLDLGNEKEVIEWTDDSIEATEKELQDMGPGDVLTSDALIDLQKHEGDVPELEWYLKYLVNEISSALPTPLPLAVDFAGDINRDVTSDQRESYQQTIAQEREVQERSWTQAIKFVAERAGLPTEGLEFKIQPKQSDNPVKSLETEEIDRMNTYVNTLATAAGPQAGPTALVDSEDLLDVLDFPVEETTPEDIAEEMAQGDEATKQAWDDILGVEALQAFSAGSWVDTPDGLGITDEPITEGTVDDMEASEDNPVYAVAMLDESGGPNFYRESDLSEGDPPEVEGVDDPTEALWKRIKSGDEGDAEALQFGEFDYPESWEESPTPNRVILLDAFSSMGGTFTGARETLGSSRLAASIKDAVWMTHDWRGGWAD